MGHRALGLRLLEVILQGHGTAFHRRELHADAEQTALPHRVPERRHVLAEEVLHLVVAIELAPHLREVVDLEHHRLGTRLSLPPVRDEEHAPAEAAGKRPQLRPRPVHADQLNDPLRVVVHLLARFGRIDHAGSAAREPGAIRVEVDPAGRLGQIQQHAHPRAWEVVPQGGVVRFGRGAADEVRAHRDALEAQHHAQECRDRLDPLLRLAADDEEPEVGAPVRHGGLVDPGDLGDRLDQRPRRNAAAGAIQGGGPVDDGPDRIDPVGQRVLRRGRRVRGRHFT